nr:PREDICTED: uncharacterized protein LOC105678445 isoform X3 [Linepithema humile]
MIPSCSEQGRIWKSVKIDDKDYMICFTEEKDSWKILLTDLIELWMETLTDETMFHKYLVKGTPEQFWENVTMPLSLSSMELIRRHEILLDLIKRKDEEIAEYKAEGAELIRKYIATKPFSEELFHINTATPVGIDFVKAFQSVICFYNAINLPKLHIKTESEISSNNASDNNVLNNENVYSNLSKNEFVQNLKSDELDEDEQVYTKVEECEAGSSNSKAPILKISSISHTIQRFRKNKKTFNDFIL